MDKKLSEFYGLSILKDFIWQDKVLSFWDPTSGLPEIPAVSDRYIASVTGGPSGEEWTKNYIYEWYFDQWVEIVPKTGTVILISENSKYYYFNGSGWVLFDTIIDHNELNGTLGGEYHLDETTYNNVNGQDQSLKITDNVTFNDITITTPTSIYSSLSHNSFNDYIANEHINHSNISISAGTGLSGGGDLTTNRELSLNANLNNLNDVDNTAPTDGQTILWNSETNKWKPFKITPLLNAAYYDTFTGASVTVTHNLNVPNVLVFTYDNTNTKIDPTNVELIDDNNVLIEFDISTTFTAVIMEPGAPVNTILSYINFKGRWSTLSGLLETPASSYHNNKFWVLVEDVILVEDEEPGISTKWVNMYDGVIDSLSSVNIGDLANVEDSGILDSQALIWDESLSKYVPGESIDQYLLTTSDVEFNSTTYGNYRIEHNDIEDSLDFIYDPST